MSSVNKLEILKSIDLFSLDLQEKNILTEAATGTYSATAIIAAKAGANVFAYAKQSKYGKLEEIKKSIKNLSVELGVSENITIIYNLDEIDLHSIDILTNTGFNRPINSTIINKLSPKCVIPLMYEPWEFRDSDIDLNTCYLKGIKVYGTNEHDNRLNTMDAIGYNVLYLLLDNGKIPTSDYKILLIGNEDFVDPVYKILSNNNYRLKRITEYSVVPYVNESDVIVVLEHKRKRLIIGETGYINAGDLGNNNFIIHIAGNVDIQNFSINCIPENPREFGSMSFLVDYISPTFLVNLLSAGLKVAEGMLKANELGIKSAKYKNFMETNYPSLSFENPKYH